MLRQFEVNKPTIKEYTQIEQEKTLIGIDTSLGRQAPKELVDAVLSMKAPELSNFWNRFSKIAIRLGMEYSSEAVVYASMKEFFDEDLIAIVRNLT